ncbi:MAG: choice-of-anchor D domain-containing protein [Phycisphaerae bacterium]|nr:choice-of-anchor D domain-containing protein [Phycisphaerae bacterium]
MPLNILCVKIGLVMFHASIISIFASISILCSTSFLHAGNRGSGGWTIVNSYQIPEGASGLAWDGTNIYFGIYGVDGGRIYRVDPSTGIYTPQFVGDHEDAFGLTYDGEYLWTTDHAGSSSTPATALKLDWNGNTIDSFDLPDHYMSGIAFDNGDFWVSRYYPDPCHLYKVNDAGDIIDEFDGPDDQPWDLAIENGLIWIADYYGNTLYCVDPSNGSVISSHPSEGEDPAGVVWDGQYLWYCDNGDNWDEDILYKVDLQGGGSPEIIISDSEHAFGNVAIGDSLLWNVNVTNSGTANLVISEVAFPAGSDLSCLAIFPVVISAGSSSVLPIEYSPTSFGPINSTVFVNSNDPIHSSVPLAITGHGVYPEQTIYIEELVHDFGQVRSGAHTRWFIDVTNQGELPLVIKNATVDNESFYIDPEVTFPMTLNTLSHVQIGVWFAPSTIADVSATVSINSNDPTMNTVLVAVTGSGEEVDYLIGTELWSSQFTDNWDNSFKAISPIPDVSGDGISDLIACSEDNFIRCFNGNADQTGDIFWEHEIYSGNIYSDRGLDIVADVNDDGHDDVVVGATGGARLIRMISGKTGDEIWTYHTNTVGGGGWVYQVDGSRDFTGDGIKDVLACAGDDGEDSGPKRAYCFNGIDGQLIWQHVVGGPVYAIIAVDDFTGDGIPDAVAGASDQWEINGVAIGIDGATGMSQWTFPVNGSSVWALAQIGDINLDGISDVMIGDFYGEYFSLSATSGIEQCSGSGLGILTGFKRIEDVNADGHPDVVPEHFNNFVRVISGKDCSTIWTTPVVDSPSTAAQINDVNNDGIKDVVVGTLFSNNYTYFLNGLDGTVLNTQNFGTPLDSIAAIPDVVGDGSWELVAGGRDGTLSCISGGIDAVVYNPADINEDGVVDVVDLLIIIDQWGQTDSSADINEDGIVNVSDLLMLIDYWGSGI